MTPRTHLFPFRTQKLSLVVPKILGWRRPGKIGRCRLEGKAGESPPFAGRAQLVSPERGRTGRPSGYKSGSALAGFVCACFGRNRRRSGDRTVADERAIDKVPVCIWAAYRFFASRYAGGPDERSPFAAQTKHTLQNQYLPGPLVKRSRRRPLTP